jgi:hypothetical protein
MDTQQGRRRAAPPVQSDREKDEAVKRLEELQKQKQSLEEEINGIARDLGRDLGRTRANTIEQGLSRAAGPRAAGTLVHPESLGVAVEELGSRRRQERRQVLLQVLLQVLQEVMTLHHCGR